MENNTNLNEKDILAIREKRLSPASFQTLSKFYSIFADPTRLTLVSLLSENELCVNDIALIMDRSQSRVFHQLIILRISLKQDLNTSPKQTVIFIRTERELITRSLPLNKRH